LEKSDETMTYSDQYTNLKIVLWDYSPDDADDATTCTGCRSFL